MCTAIRRPSYLYSKNQALYLTVTGTLDVGDVPFQYKVYQAQHKKGQDNGQSDADYSCACTGKT